MAEVYGIEGKLYYKVAGVGGAGDWVELENCINPTLNMEGVECDLTARANGRFKATGVSLNDSSVDLEMIWDTADVDFTAIQEAFNRTNDLTKNLIGISVMDGAIATEGSQGLRADMAVTKFTRSEQNEDAMRVSVTLKPTRSTTAPAWYTVPAPS